MKYNPANIGPLGWPRRIADPVDRQTVIAIAAVILAGALVIGVTFWGTSARSEEAACPIMTATDFANRLVSVRDRLRFVQFPERSDFVPSSPIDADEAFLDLAIRCLRERDVLLNRVKTGR